MKTQAASLRYLHIAPRKVRFVADTIRGLSVSEAEAQLLLRRDRAAKPLLKLLRSAVANASNNQKLTADTLRVSHITVDQGPMLKRFLPRAMGRATPIHKKMSHVSLLLTEVTAKPSRFVIAPPEKKKPAKEKAKTKAKSETKKAEQPRENRGFFKKIFQRKSV